MREIIRIRTLVPVVLLCILVLTGCKKGFDRGETEHPEDSGTMESSKHSEMNSSAQPQIDENKIQGAWKLVYAEIREADSVQVKDLTYTDFIKIIGSSHFAFFNQDRGTSDNFMSGAGSYTFDGSNYVETLDFISVPEIRGHEFAFEVQIRGDSLIQQGHEKVEAADIDRYILEKYVRIKK
jgi:hypothetical protein